MRRPIGLVLLVIGILGLILPVLPGWPFLIPAIVLLGRRDPTLRRMHWLVRAFLRWMRRHRRLPWLRSMGVRLSSEYIRARAVITPMILATERMLDRSLESA